MSWIRGSIRHRLCAASSRSLPLHQYRGLATPFTGLPSTTTKPAARSETPPCVAPQPPPQASRVAPTPSAPLNESDLQEKFVRGSGAGGQAVAKTSNAVQLVHVPTGTRVVSHATRSQAQNRVLARREMRERLDVLERGAGSVKAVRE